MLLTPPLLLVLGGGFGLIFTAVPAMSPSLEALRPVIEEVALLPLSTLATCFVTARVGKTPEVAVVSAIAPLGFFFYMDTTRGFDAREVLTPVIALLVFTSGVAGAYLGYRRNAKKRL